jgi:hypothetical protein
MVMSDEADYCSGGFVASSKKPRGEHEAGALSAEQRAALDAIMQRNAPYSLATRSEQFTYRVQVQDESGSREVTVQESDLPQSLKDIVSY